MFIFTFSLYSVLQNAWHLVPKRFRSAPFMVKLRERVGLRFKQHQQGLYSARFFLIDVEGAAQNSSSCIAKTVCKYFHPGRVVDVGCGSGALLEGFVECDVKVLGLEYSVAGCDIARQRGLPVYEFDVRHDSIESTWGSFDVVLCTEVAEHVPEEYASRLVEILSSLGRHIIFTAAQPGQGGTGHVNEKPREYWIAKFQGHLCEYKQLLTEQVSNDWRLGGVESWYWRNLLIFSRLS